VLTISKLNIEPSVHRKTTTLSPQPDSAWYCSVDVAQPFRHFMSIVTPILHIPGALAYFFSKTPMRLSEGQGKYGSTFLIIGIKRFNIVI
jgi:hypothetical protein